jgi:hypothetical protein
MTVNLEPAGLDRVLAACDAQIAWCRGNGAPFTGNIVEVIRENIAGAGALTPLVVPWPGRPQADALQLRIAGALHFLVRTKRAPELARFYPGHGDGAWDSAAVAGALEAAVAANAVVVQDMISRPPQTNEIGRAAALMPGYAEIARRTGLPLRILEVGASAGLNLNWHRYAYRYGEHFVGAADAPLSIKAEWRGAWCRVEALPRVVERRGCDRAPIDVGDAHSAERLISYTWPEQSERLARLEAAIALARRERPPLEPGDAAEWLERQLAAPRQGVATVVAHTIVWQYFSKETAVRAKGALLAAGERASENAPLAWLSLEQYAPDLDPELRLQVWPGGGRELLAHAHPHGAWIRWHGQNQKPELSGRTRGRPVN